MEKRKKRMKGDIERRKKKKVGEIEKRKKKERTKRERCVLVKELVESLKQFTLV